MPERLQRKRSDYTFWQTHQTPWSDNDQYGHVNNSVYAHYFDSIITLFLVQQCSMNLKIESTDHVNVVKSWTEYFAPTSFPTILDIGMRVKHLGRSSVDYEFAAFEQGVNLASVVGGHRLVSVDGVTRRSREWSAHMKHGFGTTFCGDPTADVRVKL